MTVVDSSEDEPATQLDDGSDSSSTETVHQRQFRRHLVLVFGSGHQERPVVWIWRSELVGVWFMIWEIQNGVLFERLVPRDRALIRSQAGPGVGLVLTIFPRPFSRRSRFTCSSDLVAALPFAFALVAGAAVQSIRLATTGCMCEGRCVSVQGLQWKVWRRAFAERQGDASLPM